MLVTLKLGAEFSRGCALPVIARRFLATHPSLLRKRTGVPLKGLRSDEDTRYVRP
jgi:hypothetical protein